MEPSYTVKWYSCPGKQFHNSSMQLHSQFQYPRVLKIYPHKNLCMNIHSSIIPNSQKLETPICPSTNEWKNQNVVFSYSGIISGNKKGWRMACTTTCMNFKNIMLSESRAHTAWSHLYEMSRVGKSTEIEKLVLAVARDWGKERIGSQHSYRVSFWGWWKCSKVDSCGGFTTLNILKATEIVHFKWYVCYV